MREIRLLLLLCAALTLSVVACETKKDDEGGAKTEESAGEGEVETTAGETGETGEAEATGDETAAADPAQPEEPPPPPPEAFKGEARIINLYRDAEGNTPTVDVWAKRSFTAGPVKLAEGVEFATASEWFKVPESQSVTIVAAGADSDADSLGSIFGPKENERITGLMVSDGGKPSVATYWDLREPPDDQVLTAPPAGSGVVQIRANQLSDFDTQLQETVGGRSFYVGNGEGGCVRQRVEDKGFSPAVLGGTNPTVHDVPAGTATFTLHKWPSNEKCATEPVYTFDVEVADGKATLVQIYTPDAKTLAHLQLPIDTVAAPAEDAPPAE